MKTTFPVISFAELVENQNKALASIGALFRGYCFQRGGPAFRDLGIKPVEVTLPLFSSLINGENAMLKRAFHEVPRQVESLLILRSNEGRVLIFFDVEAADCGTGLCRYLTPLARTAEEQNFVRALVIASQSAMQIHRLWIQGGRQYHPLASNGSQTENFEALYPEAAELAGIEASAPALGKDGSPL